MAPLVGMCFGITYKVVFPLLLRNCVEYPTLSRSTFLLYYRIQTFVNEKVLQGSKPLILDVCRHSRFIHTSPYTSKRDFFEVLGVSKNANKATIKKAYYQISKKYHPDVNKADPNSANKFQEVSESYEILSDEDNRRNYDSFGDAGSQFAGSGGFQGAAGYARNY